MRCEVIWCPCRVPSATVTNDYTELLKRNFSRSERRLAGRISDYAALPAGEYVPLDARRASAIEAAARRSRY